MKQSEELNSQETADAVLIRRAVLIWKFKDAPKDLRLLSNNGGDEDWIAHFPPEWTASDIKNSFPRMSGINGSVSICKHPTIGVVAIWSHA